MPAATKEEISQWIADGIKKKATHLVVVLDTFDFENFPLFIMPGENPRERFHEKYTKDRPANETAYQSEECYWLGKPADELAVQVAGSGRAQEWDLPAKEGGDPPATPMVAGWTDDQFLEMVGDSMERPDLDVEEPVDLTDD